MGSFVMCKSLETGKSVTVKITDLGPNKRLGRMIDLTHGAFKRISDPKNGLTLVTCREVKS